MLQRFIGFCAFLLFVPAMHVAAQCTATISSFPYIENFEAGMGNWSSGGTSSSWAYGTPTKQVVNAAASGSQCWTTGKLAGGGYNNGESSWLMSPCYNFSSLSSPQLSFKVFWETEKKYDGASLQYSADGGTSWQTLGKVSDNSNCTAVNWFNTTTVTTLGMDGWSGNIQPTSPCPGGAGNGSGAWVTAKHSLSMLAGKPSVAFRFLFTAGTQCNAYDGFAVDDIIIAETPASTADFVYGCSASNTVDFTSTSSLCATNYLWNFGDVTSPNNTSTLENPSHVYTSAGSYTVTFTVTFPGNIIVVKTKNVTVLNVVASVVTPIVCNGDNNGKLIVNVTGGNGNYAYVWNTVPPQTTQVASNVVAGSYAVMVSAANACPTVATINLNQPSVLLASAVTSNAICGHANGSATVNVSGGNAPYQYTWSNGGTGSMESNLMAGNYSVQVTDANTCSRQISNIVVKDSIKQLALNLGKDTSFCPGNQTVLNAGSFINYLWQDNSTQPTFTVTQTGTYSVKVTDADGCVASDTIFVNVDCSDLYFPSAFTPNNDTKNDVFGPIGNLYAITKFDMRVYGRWGQLIFSTTNPFNKWDGKLSGTDLDQGVYVWMATYSLNNGPSVFKKGTITIVR